MKESPSLKKIEKQHEEPVAVEMPQGLEEKLAWMLKSARQKAGLSQADIVQKTKIHHKMVEAMEKGEFRKLPSQAHVRAFVLAIAQVCNADEKAVMAAWREVA